MGEQLTPEAVERHPYLMTGTWELSPDEIPGIWRDDPDGADPHCVALFRRVYDEPRLRAIFLARRADAERIKALEAQAWLAVGYLEGLGREGSDRLSQGLRAVLNPTQERPV